ncbi:MAG: Tic22 family protein [Cyanobacteriota bacterium]|nr:Tic22 family protein [Cyanobacteriota bacterium]
MLAISSVSPALAMTTTEIAAELNQVPVFLIRDAEGEHLKAVSEADPNLQAPLVFLDGQSAAGVLQQIEAEGQEAKIEVVDLGTVYQQSAADGTAGPLLYWPIRAELEAATALQPNFQGVPLFVPRRGQTESYLPFIQGEEVSLPMFFSRQDLQTYVNWVFEDNPAGAQEIVVEVRSLEWLLATMASTTDQSMSQQLEQVKLFPSTEVLRFLESVRTQQGSQPQP